MSRYTTRLPGARAAVRLVQSRLARRRNRMLAGHLPYGIDFGALGHGGSFGIGETFGPLGEVFSLAPDPVHLPLDPPSRSTRAPRVTTDAPPTSATITGWRSLFRWWRA